MRAPPTVLFLCAAAACAGRGAARRSLPESPPQRAPSTAPDAGLWGFADLHVHPAAHLAFGAENALGGALWGSPGGRFEDSDPRVDLPPCEPGSHDPGDLDLIRGYSRGDVIDLLDGQTDFPHQRGGWPSFKGWPSSQSLSHQQMHVSWLHRAWEGGLRLIIADAVDTELIAMAWRQGFNRTNAAGDSRLANRVHPVPGFDFRSAERQVAFIRQLAEQNATWMTVVTTAQEAEEAIAQGKLAVVLGVEMDALTLEEVQQLYRLGVRHIVPIHLANSASFGGSAVYADAFNSNTKFETGDFFRIHPGGDPTLAFRLSEELQEAAPFLPVPFDLGYQVVLPHPAYCARYGRCAGDDGATTPNLGFGQTNALGLKAGGEPIEGLMRLGMLIDVAHMGDESTRGVLALSRKHGYPVLDTHTDLADRDDDWRNSERDLRRADAKEILAGGGMIGLGTGPHTNPQLIAHWAGAPLAQLSGAHPRFLEALPLAGEFRIRQLEVRLWGGRAKPPSARLVLYLADEWEPRQIPLTASGVGEPWTWQVPVDLRGVDLVGLGIRAGEGAWELAGLEIDAQDEQGRTRPLLSRFGAPLMVLTPNEPEWSTTLPRDRWPSRERWAKEIDLHVITGADDLRGNQDDGNDNAVARVEHETGEPPDRVGYRRRSKHHRRDPKRPVFSAVRGNRPEQPLAVFEASLNRGLPVRSGHPGDSTDARVILPDEIPVTDLANVGVVTWFRGGIGGDNWNIDGIDVIARSAGGEQTRLATHRGSPWERLTASSGIASAYETLARPPADAPANHLTVTIVTGADHPLEPNDTAEAVVLLANRDEPLVWPLNEGQAWGRNVTRSITLRLPDETRVRDLLAFGVRWRAGGGRVDRSWDLQEISLEVLSDPLENWLAAYQEAISLLGGGIALGSDLNGLAPQIAYSTEPVSYPFQPACRLAQGCPHNPPLDRLETGERSFDLREDGIAQIGMEPDFLEALRTLRGGSRAVDQLYGSAGEFVRTWARVETARECIQHPCSLPAKRETPPDVEPPK